MEKRLSIRVGKELVEEMKKIKRPVGYNSWSDGIRNYIRETTKNHYKNHWNKAPPF